MTGKSPPGVAVYRVQITANASVDNVPMENVTRLIMDNAMSRKSYSKKAVLNIGKARLGYSF